MSGANGEPDAINRSGGRHAQTAVLYRREGCHLCEEVEAEARSLGVVGKMIIVDIDGDPELQARYFLRVPVVEVDGREAFEAKMMDRGGKWREKLFSLLVG